MGVSLSSRAFLCVSRDFLHFLVLVLSERSTVRVVNASVGELKGQVSLLSPAPGLSHDESCQTEASGAETAGPFPGDVALVRDMLRRLPFTRVPSPRDMACSVAGITSDANVLTNELRLIAQRYGHGEPAWPS